MIIRNELNIEVCEPIYWKQKKQRAKRDNNNKSAYILDRLIIC